MKTTLTQDSTSDQRIGALPSQKNPRRKENGSSAENSTARTVKLQTSFPPIHFSLSTPTRSADKGHKEHASNANISREIRGQKINLPQVEKPVEKIPKASKHVTAAEKSKLAIDLSRAPRPHSGTPLVPLDGTRDMKLEKQTWLDASLPNALPERLSPEATKVPECATCKKERRIRNDYDKIIVQSRQDKEVLQQRITELEAEMEKYKEEANNKQQETRGPESGTYHTGQQTEEVVNFQSFAEMYDNTLTSTTNGTTDLRKLEEENKKKQEKIDSLLIEIEEFKAQLGKIQEDEKTHTQKMKSKHSKLVLDLEDLKSQLEKTQAREKRQLSDLEQEKQNILLQLETTKSELEKFKKRRVLTLTELRKEKDTCLAEIEELKACTEKMREENSLLQERVNVFEQDLDKRAPCPCLPSHAYTVPASTEMLLISHQVSQQSSFSIATGCRNCWCSTYGGTMQDFSAPKCAETKGPLEEETTRFKDMYKQLKRERNLLLDVMVIMYTRRWFVEEAVPHVKRALRKCGVASEEAD